MVKYIPSRGDIVWLEFDPQKGKEIQKTRPSVVISPQSYNQKSEWRFSCPLLAKLKDILLRSL